jgi:hypothetical protein
VPATVDVTLGSLIEETLLRLQRPSEFPLTVEVGANPLETESDTVFTLASGADLVEPTDVLEFGMELVLVTSKSSAAIPEFRCARGYGGSPRGTAQSGTVGLKSPTWPRWQVRQSVVQATQSGLTTLLPEVATLVEQIEPGAMFLEVPPDTLDVHQLAVILDDGRHVELMQWDYLPFLPETVVPSGKAVQVPSEASTSDHFLVTLSRPYRWETGGVEVPAAAALEASTVALPIAGQDLPALWAAAKLATGRELSRSELDKVEEWNQEAAIRQGVNLRLVRELWTECYRRVDEVRRTQPLPKHRPFKRMRRI